MSGRVNKPSTLPLPLLYLVKKGRLLSVTESNDFTILIMKDCLRFQTGVIIHFLKLLIAENINLAQSGLSITFSTFIDVQWRERAEAE